jgi:hypothetical protein
MILHNDVAELAAEELRTDEKEQAKADNCYIHHDLDWAYDRARV